jgi:transcriptional regulator with XRE-family HTH domain
MAINKPDQSNRPQDAADFEKLKVKWSGVKPRPVDPEKLLQAADKRNKEIQETFGKNLARIRKQAGYSQLSLSAEVDLTHNFINELEQGYKGASFNTIARLSIILRTPAHEFFEPTERRPPDDDFQYPSPTDQAVLYLHESLDRWRDEQAK